MVKVSIVPNFFICPLSLEVMKDPVTLCTGQTYDRGSIEKWFASGQDTVRCPSTMQVLSTHQLVSNDYLRGLIADWCAVNVKHPIAKSSQKVNEVAPVVPSVGVSVLREIFTHLQKRSTKDSQKILRNLGIQMKESNSTKRAVIEAGGVSAICNLIFASTHLSQSQAQNGESRYTLEEALELLIRLPSDCIRIEADILPKLVTILSWLLSSRLSSTNARIRAATLLARILTPSNDDPDQDGVLALVAASVGVFEGLVQVLKEDSYPKARDAGLKACLPLLQSRENILKGVEAGLVFPVIEFLSASRGCSTSLERALSVLEQISTTEEGRKTMSDHALTVPVLANIIVQDNSSENEKAKAISCLWVLCSQLGKDDAERCIHEALAHDGLSARLLDLSRSRKATCSPVNVALEQHVVYLKSLLQCKSRTCAQFETLY